MTSMSLFTAIERGLPCTRNQILVPMTSSPNDLFQSSSKTRGLDAALEHHPSSVNHIAASLVLGTQKMFPWLTLRLRVNARVGHSQSNYCVNSHLATETDRLIDFSFIEAKLGLVVTFNLSLSFNCRALRVFILTSPPPPFTLYNYTDSSSRFSLRSPAMMIMSSSKLWECDTSITLFRVHARSGTTARRLEVCYFWIFL